MNKKRLLKLADLLEADAKDKNGISFNFAEWGFIGDHDTPLSCGTQACAMGLAALSGAFKRAGLDYERGYGSIDFTWKGEPIEGLDAAERLFDIPNWAAWELFIPRDGDVLRGGRAELALAKRIRRFVAQAPETRAQ